VTSVVRSKTDNHATLTFSRERTTIWKLKAKNPNKCYVALIYPLIF